MEVYIEYAILDNFIIDFLLLKYTFIILNNKAPLWRILLCSLISTFFAVSLPLLSVKKVTIIFIKIIFPFLVIAVSNNFKTVKNFIISLAIFYLATFMTGGAISGVFSFFGIPKSTEISLSLIILLAFIFIKFSAKTLLFLYRQKNVRAFIKQCEIVVSNKRFKVKGFFDTGNNLYSDGSPVIMCSKKLALKMINPLQTKTTYLNVSTVTGSERILIFKIDELLIYNEDKPNIFNNVTIGISKQPLENSGYEIILHSSCL